MIKVAGSIPGRGCPDLYYARDGGGTANEGVGCDQSIGSTVSDAIVQSWLWSTATRSSQLGYCCRLMQVVDYLLDLIILWETPGHRRLYLYFYWHSSAPLIRSIQRYYYYCYSSAPIIIIIIIKKDWQCKAGRGRLTPYQSEDPSPHYQPIEENKRKRK